METAAQETGNRVVVITGAGQGIGAAIARRFADQGERLVLVDVNTEHLRQLVASLEDTGCEILPVIADVSSKEQVKHLVAQAKEAFGGIDVLVNNAGIIRDNLI
ncbi:MAG: SDR family NAD(P)-dependent oxidoreductase, partial [Desulfuromonadales bacterium]|nr:SDR family NAD(P)-dependent oxidoreductase [Desulfuromonadales bacterium]